MNKGWVKTIIDKCSSEKIINEANNTLPPIGIGIMAFYGYCSTSCSSLKGTLYGIDLVIVGICFMFALLVINMPDIFQLKRIQAVSTHLRTFMLSAAIGGEILLFRFQVENDVYCPYCLAFATCVIIMFLLNLKKMSPPLAFGSLLFGGAVFALFFNGTILPLY